MGLTPSQIKVSAWINNPQWYEGAGYVIFAGAKHPSMVAVNVLGNPFAYVKPTHPICLKLTGRFAGSKDEVHLEPDQAEELAARLLELAARARQLRRVSGG